MLNLKPSLNLLAETGGKNATIVTALADRDQAIKNVLQSAFSHSGQKCSATSLLLLEDEIYQDTGFRQALCDAVESLKVGSAWDLQTKIGPLIRPPSGELEKGLKELEVGQSWAVMPQLGVDGNPHLVSPGVKWDVAPGSDNHCTEFFGPLLGVMRFADLHEAIEIVNATGYGLTSGLESLDERECAVWQQGIRAGNLYINRPTTGAIVLRQPFGGMGKSSVGPGIKAGGPNYVVPLSQLTVVEDASVRPANLELEEVRHGHSHGNLRRPAPTRLGNDPSDALQSLVESLGNDNSLEANERNRAIGAIQSYRKWAEVEFLEQHDHFRIVGEDNLRRYLPIDALRIRVHQDDSLWEITARAAAARAVGALATISTPSGLSGAAAEGVERLDSWTETWAGALEFVEESDEQLADAIRREETERVRFAAPQRVPASIRQAAAEVLQYVADAPVVPQGRVELLWYVQEQSLSHRYHRYGNLGRRSDEPRDEPA